VCPDGDQLALARALAAAGADVIAGHHAHVLQGVDTVEGALVAYGLGNFVFYARTPATRQTGVLTVTVAPDGTITHDWSPAVIDGRGQPQAVPTQAPIPTGETLTATSTGPACGPPTSS
jgi:poly-gamma-glutamate capsule biosynthesis protein CapA/YwtB (metallophosphatase superfamily)